MRKVTVIVAAGGRGLRLGADRPKQLLAVGGRAILERAVSAFLSHPEVTEVVVALPAELADSPPDYLQATSKPLRVVQGGERRQDSVQAAFQASARDADVILVHDAARPFVSADLISRTIEAALHTGAAIAALPARDTVKRVDHVSGGPLVVETLPRESTFLAQTPQAFRREVLEAALTRATSIHVTDEAMLVEHAGLPVQIVEGEPTNIKITTPEDWPVAETIAAAGESRPTGFRIGTGYDLHRLVEGRPLVLGGVTIPHDRGLLGHSDADAVCHAVTDAVLGAAGAGDIGRHFPDDDEQWRGASSLDLLGRAVSIVGQLGFAIVNVDVVVVAERPKIAPYIQSMREHLAAALGVTISAVSIKGKTNEGVDEIGRGEAIATHAVALLELGARSRRS
jgi:2-C-methyl-D-erythritol 4-phosphate cytidylyltransferase/2-C-methyl-D-erythritol 2,4-cyclodiphosphate synthase